MQPKFIDKLIELKKKYKDLTAILSSEQIMQDYKRYRELSKEYALIEPIVLLFKEYEKNLLLIDDSEKFFIEDCDKDLKKIAHDDILYLSNHNDELIKKIKLMLLPQDDKDSRNIFLEIRAGTGGNEAAVFAGNLFRMYTRYIESNNWTIEIINMNHGEHGGYKEIIARVIGHGVYSKLKFESGVHRVQRVPITDAQGRIHTSTCTVAIIIESTEIDSIDINPADLKIDTFRSSGAGGQHVNVTDSAIRITHIPTNIIVECQNERSQHKNRAYAMSLLKSRLLIAEQEKQRQKEVQIRRNLVGTGDRSERIRTYNFPQGRLTDHRINLTLYQLDKIMEGELQIIIDSLIQEHQTDQLISNFED